jgi:hypothetical protein
VSVCDLFFLRLLDVAAVVFAPEMLSRSCCPGVAYAVVRMCVWSALNLSCCWVSAGSLFVFVSRYSCRPCTTTLVGVETCILMTMVLCVFIANSDACSLHGDGEHMYRWNHFHTSPHHTRCHNTSKLAIPLVLQPQRDCDCFVNLLPYSHLFQSNATRH